jgi:hypothetical protein
MRLRKSSHLAACMLTALISVSARAADHVLTIISTYKVAQRRPPLISVKNWQVRHLRASFLVQLKSAVLAEPRNRSAVEKQRVATAQPDDMALLG